MGSPSWGCDRPGPSSKGDPACPDATFNAALGASGETAEPVQAPGRRRGEWGCGLLPGAHSQLHPAVEELGGAGRRPGGSHSQSTAAFENKGSLKNALEHPELSKFCPGGVLSIEEMIDKERREAKPGGSPAVLQVRAGACRGIARRLGTGALHAYSCCSPHHPWTEVCKLTYASRPT